MSNTQIALLAMVGVIAAVLLIVLVIVPELKKKNVNVDKIVKVLEDKGEVVEKAADELRPILPKKTITILDTIEKWCPIGAGYAQQLAHTGDIDKEDRAAAAEDVVLDVFKELDIDVTDRRKSLIKAAIENAVNDLGHEEPVGKLSYEVDVKPSKATQNKADSKENTQSKAENTVNKDEAATDSTNTAQSVEASTASTTAPQNADISTPQQTEAPKTVEERVSSLEGQINQISTNISNIAAAITPSK